MSKVSLLLSFAAMSLPMALQAATGKPVNLAEEYEQVRKIAARDPKVRAAYEAADRRLADKIVEIDPALRGYTPGKAAPAPAPAKVAPAKKAAPTPAPAKTKATTHVVAKGETLGEIAGKYNVSTAALMTANQIKDERKLAVGQKLIIPGGKAQATAKPATSRQATAKPTSTKPAPAKDESFWNKWF